MYRLHSPAMPLLTGSVKLTIIFFSSNDGDGDEPSAFPSTSGAGSSASTTEENIEKLSEMFPHATRKELENYLKDQASMDQAVLTLLHSKTSLVLSDDDSDLMVLKEQTVFVIIHTP